PAVPSDPTATEPLAKALQASLDRLRRHAGIPGVSATIVFADGSRWTGVSGLADVAAGRKVTPDTAFAVGSISKTFLATLILALAAEGRIDLDASVRTYLPAMRFSRAITVRQLLDHTSGLADFFFGRKVDAALLADRSATWTPARTLTFVGKPYFAPGTGWHYSNTNYLVLGLLAEHVGGVSLATQYRARFFDPLKLSEAFYEVAERPHGPLAHGYRFTGKKATLPPIDLSEPSGIAPFRSVVTAAGGAGSIAASSRDIAAWARALYGGEVLDPPTLATMFAGVGATARYHPKTPYGLGVQAPLVNGYRTYGHSGRLLGFQSVVRYLPDQGLTVAVLTNQSRSDPGIIARELLRIALPPAGSCDACPPAP
ncbi:MAG TPA: serine hydrolase domain-containing protein, partial [Candidatus Limnocylindrales bacterium]